MCVFVCVCVCVCMCSFLAYIIIYKEVKMYVSTDTRGLR